MQFLSLTVECAFGMFVRRCGVLRRALLSNVTAKTANCLCMALCQLHDCCINARLKPGNLANSTPPSSEITTEEEDLVPLASDNLNITLNAGTSVGKDSRPTELLHGGEHFDDVPDRNARAWRRVGESLPHEIMCDHVRRHGLKRPTPRKWQSLDQNQP